MKLVLVRHAHAIDREPGGTDEARWLTAKGRAVARAAGEALRAEGLEVTAIVTSPLVRAVQTAELVARGLAFHGVVEVLAALAPDGSVGAAARALELQGGLVVAVGHEPGMSALASLLSGRGVGAFRKGQALLVVDGKLGFRYEP